MVNNTSKTDSRIISWAKEGYERPSKADYARFLDIAKGSCGEVRSMYYTAEDLEYVTKDIANDRRERAVKISKGIASLTARVRSN